MSDPGTSPLRIQEIATPDVLTDALRFRRAMEIDTVGILLFRPTGEVVRANDSFLRMSGFTHDDVRQGRTRWTDMTPPEWKAASARALEQFVAKGTAGPYEKQYSRIPVQLPASTLTSRPEIPMLMASLRLQALGRCSAKPLGRMEQR